MTTVDRSFFTGRGYLKDAILGARSFRVQEGGWLSGVIHEQVWDNTGQNDAMCLKGEPIMDVWWPGEEHKFIRPHPPHDFEPCGCGFYAFFDGSNDYGADAPVWGVIEGFGETVIGDYGFRTKHARLHAFVINLGMASESNHRMLTEEDADLIRLNYWNIPEFQTFEEMVAEFPPGSPELDTMPAFPTRPTE